MYMPKKGFNTAMVLLIPENSKPVGVPKKVYPSPEEAENEFLFFGSFATYGGTETDVNGIAAVKDTAAVETWFSQQIQSDCRVYVIENGKTYDIVGTPENIEMKNVLMKFKLERTGGKI